MLFGDANFFNGPGLHTVAMDSELGTTRSDGSVTWAGGVNAGNANLFMGGQPCGNFGPKGPGTFSQNDTCFFSVNGAFAMDIGLIMTSTGAGQQFIGYYGVGAIPEPGTPLLLGASLLALAAFRRRKIS